MDDRLPLSVLLLARDETAELAALIPALGFAREIVVVWDPAGAAATRETAVQLGARVFERTLEGLGGGFGPQRQFALEQCTQDWVFWIDADERLGGGAERALRLAWPGLTPGTAVAFERRGFFLGRRIRHCGWRNESVLRLFAKAHSRFDDAPVHEKLITNVTRTISGRELTLDHHSYPTWEACVTKLVRYAHANAGKAWSAGRRAGAADLALRPPLRFARQYLLQLGFLDGAHGLVLCALAAAQVFLKYAELWDRTRRGRATR